MGIKVLNIQTESRRYELRQPSNILYPVKCLIAKKNGSSFSANIINYHYRGACLHLNKNTYDLISQDPKNWYIDFYLGEQKLASNISFNICWKEDSSLNIGVEFREKRVDFKSRLPRFLINKNLEPKVFANDPTDPHRQIYLDVKDMSETGLLLETSLTNRHLLPGMILKNANLTLPGSEPIKLNLAIENARPGNEERFFLGISIASNVTKYRSELRDYLTIFSSFESDESITKIRDAGLFSKKLKGAVTFKIVTTNDEYKKILQLRFDAYGSKNKLHDGQTWNDMGGGISDEGTIIAGYIGSRLICSMELRFGDSNKKLRLFSAAKIDSIPGFETKNLVEISKLSIDPKVQGSDIFIGLIQKAHAIVIAHGNIDVLLFATKRLAKLYRGIGAEKLPVEFPHPYLKNETLCAMIVKRDTYLNGYQLNSDIWAKMYSLTNAYYEDLGLTKSNKKSQNKINISESESDKKNQIFIDPKWTKQEIACGIMYPYILESIDIIGHDKTIKILEKIGIPLSYIKKNSNWLSIAFHDEFLDQFGKINSIKELCKRAGVRGMQKDVLGINYYLLKHLISPDIAFKSFAKVVNKFNLGRSYELKNLKKGHVTVAVGPKEGYPMPKHTESCENWTSNFQAYIAMMTGSKGEVKKTACSYNGDPCCLYEINWVNIHDPYAWIKQAAAIALAMGMYFNFFGMTIEAVTQLLYFVTPVLILSLFFLQRKFRKDSDATAEELSKSQQESADKYNELQKAKMSLDERYREAKLLEKTSENIIRNQGVQDILNSSLQAICSDFEFDRSFVMLRDNANTTLSTTAMEGIDSKNAGILNFKVDITNIKKNPMVLSSVYHTGNSIFINDPKASLFQFNESSRKLIESLNTTGFIMVQIPSSGLAWGVLVVDKVSEHQQLGRKDIVLLERLSHQIGLALDKQAQLELEKKQRILFQKYVPQVILQHSHQEEPSLGGEIKQVGSMFIDIRSFTKLSTQLSPVLTLELINKFYTAVEQCTSPHNGVIDKYLGDGVLVTWGTLGNAKIDKMDMLNSVLLLKDKVTSLNNDLKSNSLPTIEFGVGMHIGESIVGNVGTENRMEFTSIGSSINIASRLEGLCKDYGAIAVISDIFDEQISKVSGEWTKVENVTIRGVSKPMNLTILKK